MKLSRPFEKMDMRKQTGDIRRHSHSFDGVTSAVATVRADCRLRVARLACEASLQSSTAALTSSHRCHLLP